MTQFRALVLVASAAALLIVPGKAYSIAVDSSD